MASRRKLEGVYLVTSPKRPVSRLLGIVEESLKGGTALVQFRDKGDFTETERTAALIELVETSRRFRVPLLVNDDPLLAARFRVDGVHIGREDPSAAEARALLGPRAIVGVTVYGGKDEERRAADAGADYVAAGPFFPSPTKPEEPVMDVEVLDRIVGRSALPVFAIGGITAPRARELAGHGVAGVAVVSAIMDAADPRRATADIVRAFAGGRRGLRDAPRGRKA